MVYTTPELRHSHNFVNLVDKKFNMLTPLFYMGRDSGKHVCYLCLCACMNLTVVRAQNLKTGHTKSCGCLKKLTNRKKKFEASFNAIFSRIERESVKRGYAFEITKEDFRKLSKEDCHYCNSPPRQKGKTFPNGNYVYNGLDRVDNTKGYSLDNVVPCCGKCNRAKDTMTKNEFLKLIGDIFMNRGAEIVY